MKKLWKSLVLCVLVAVSFLAVFALPALGDSGIDLSILIWAIIGQPLLWGFLALIGLGVLIALIIRRRGCYKNYKPNYSKRIYAWAILGIAMCLLATVTLPAVAADTSAGSGSGFNLAYFIWALLSNPVVASAVTAVILALMSYIFNRNPRAKYIIDLALFAYRHAENQGLLNNSAGFDKLKPFMAKFVDEYQKAYGQWPVPGDTALAVAVMEAEVAKKYQSAGN